MNYKIQTFLIFFISMLICSITPTVAVQINTDNSGNLDVIGLVKQTIIDIWNAFDEGNDTELTSEQKEYLEQQRPRIEKKGETILYNFQDYLNYLITEYNKYHPETETQQNFTQRTLLGTFIDTDYEKTTKNANDMKNHINNNKNLKINRESYTYEELWTHVNETSKEKIYNVSEVILQVRDPNTIYGYIRYMELIGINDTDIRFKSGSQDLKMNKTRFNELYLWNKEDGNEDMKVNILVMPPGYSYTSHILRLIWDKQDNDLITKEGRVSFGMTLIPAAGGTLGLTIIGGSIVRLCNNCKCKCREYIKEEIADIENIADIPRGEPEEDTPLIIKPIAKNSYKEKWRCHPKVSCNECGTTMSLAILGTLVATICFSIVYYMITLKGYYDKEHKNLARYEPPINTIGGI